MSPAARAAAVVVDAGPSGPAAKKPALGAEIAPLKPEPRRWTVLSPRPWYGSLWFLALQLVPPGIVGGALSRRAPPRGAGPGRGQGPPPSSPRAPRDPASAPPSQALRDGEPARFHEALWEALASYFGHRLNLLPGQISREAVTERLSRDGVDPGERRAAGGDLPLPGAGALRPSLVPGGPVPRAGAGEAGAACWKSSNVCCNRASRCRDERRPSGSGSGSGPGPGGGSSPAAAALALAVVASVWFAGKGAVPAAALREQFLAAGRAYGEGRMRDAARLYEDLIRGGHGSMEVFFNLGNAEARDGRLGAAVLNYRKAWRLAPRDPDIGANLRLALQATGASEADLSGAELVFTRLSEREWAVAAMTAWWATGLLALPGRPLRGTGGGSCCASARCRRRSRSSRSSASGRGGGFERAPELVVLNDTQNALRAPQASATPQFSLPEGSLVRARERQGEWVRVSYGQLSGWIRRAACAPVLLGGASGMTRAARRRPEPLKAGRPRRPRLIPGTARSGHAGIAGCFFLRRSTAAATSSAAADQRDQHPPPEDRGDVLVPDRDPLIDVAALDGASAPPSG